MTENALKSLVKYNKGGVSYARYPSCALDLDGTVFNDEKEITPRTLEAIRAAIAKGVDVIPATGRVASGVPEAFCAFPACGMP